MHLPSFPNETSTLRNVAALTVLPKPGPGVVQTFLQAESRSGCTSETGVHALYHRALRFAGPPVWLRRGGAALIAG